MSRLQAIGHITPSAVKSPTVADMTRDERLNLYKTEKKLIEERFKSVTGNNFSWGDPEVQKELKAVAKQIITVSQEYIDTEDLVDVVLPTADVEPGDTYVHREFYGVDVHYGTYGGAIRTSRPNFRQYTAKPVLKEVGFDLKLVNIRTGKYSPTEVADYARLVITSWRNHLLFTTTIKGMAAFQSGGAQYQAGTSVAFATVDKAINKVTDEADVGFIVGRRAAINKLAHASGWSEVAKRQYETIGQVGSYNGIPVIRVNSFTDPIYGTVSPFGDDELFFFSELPIGYTVYADRLRMADEIILANESMKIYMRWDDIFGIFWANRGAILDAIT